MDTIMANCLIRLHKKYIFFGYDGVKSHVTATNSKKNQEYLIKFVEFLPVFRRKYQLVTLGGPVIRVETREYRQIGSYIWAFGKRPLSMVRSERRYQGSGPPEFKSASPQTAIVWSEWNILVNILPLQWVFRPVQQK